MLQGNGRPALNGDVGLECGGIPVAFDLDPGESRADLGKIGGVERDVSRADVLLKAVNLGRPRDRDDPGLLGDEPGERDLGARRALARGDRPQKLDEGEVGLASRLREARHDVAEIVLRNGRDRS